MKIHLGCGNLRIGSHINIDAVATHSTDMVYDLSKGLPPEFQDETVDEIVSFHFIEHLSKEEAVLLLKDMYRVMKSGATGVMELPDMERLCKNLMRNPEGVIWDIYGKQDEPGMNHKYGYTKETIKKTLESVGFKVTGFPKALDYHVDESIRGIGFNAQMRVEFRKP
jgi:predicted SAM-dependent methyltransferase